MLKTTSMILDDLKNYKNPASKLGRMAKSGEYTQIVRGLYETDRFVPGYLLAGCIYGPSYLSFEFALGYYGIIPEAVYTFTSATYDKKKKKMYETPFGRFTYRDIPAAAYPFDILLVQEGDYTFQIASPEKALCDKIYELSPVNTQKAMLELLMEDLRIEQETLRRLSLQTIGELNEKYHSTNVELLHKTLKRMR